MSVRSRQGSDADFDPIALHRHDGRLEENHGDGGRRRIVQGSLSPVGTSDPIHNGKLKIPVFFEYGQRRERQQR